MQEQFTLLDLDLIACQEVFQASEGTYSTVKYLADSLRIEPIWFPSRWKEREIESKRFNSYSGLCIFTRHEPIEVHTLHLPSDPRDGERTAQLVVFKLNYHKIALVNTHLTHLENAQILRSRQLQTIIMRLKEFEDLDGYLLCGDLNSVPSSPLIQFLQETLPTMENVFSAPYPATHLSGKAIDYIFYSPNKSLRLLDARIVMNQPVKGVLPSDHYGVLAHFAIGGKR